MLCRIETVLACSHVSTRSLILIDFGHLNLAGTQAKTHAASQDDKVPLWVRSAALEQRLSSYLHAFAAKLSDQIIGSLNQQVALAQPRSLACAVSQG